MIKDIVRDINFLKIKSIDATLEDLPICKDLKDTLNAHKDTCVGMAANMIGYSKRIIIVNMGLFNQIMINPAIIDKKGKYSIKEGCLSLFGEREAIRYREIVVEYLDESFNKQKNTFKNFIAEIIEHEIDHLNGIII